jgi:hypothetical protein
MQCGDVVAPSVTLHVPKARKDEYQIKQSATAAGIPGTTEQYILDWEWRENDDAFFGKVRGRNRWSRASSRKECQMSGRRGKVRAMTCPRT